MLGTFPPQFSSHLNVYSQPETWCGVGVVATKTISNFTKYEIFYENDCFLLVIVRCRWTLKILSRVQTAYLLGKITKERWYGCTKCRKTAGLVCEMVETTIFQCDFHWKQTHKISIFAYSRHLQSSIVDFRRKKIVLVLFLLWLCWCIDHNRWKAYTCLFRQNRFLVDLRVDVILVQSHMFCV